MKGTLLFFIIFSLIILALIEIFSLTLVHEIIHKQTLSYFGVNSTIVMDFVNLKFYTEIKPEEQKYCISECIYLQGENEVIGYYLSYLMIFFIPLQFFYLIKIFHFIVNSINDSINNYKFRKIKHGQ